MKSTWLLFLATLTLAPLANADQTASYPKKNPLIDLTFPDGWEIKHEDALFANPKDDQSFFVSVAPLESTNEQIEEAVAEVKELIEGDFENVTYEELQKIEGEGVASLLLQANGTDSDGKANIFNLIINQPKGKSLLLLQIIASPDGFEKHAEAGKQLMLSVKAHASTQTFAYPNKKEPVFTVDFPAGWIMDAEAESCQALSADKFVNVNVLLIDAGEKDVALGKLKESVGGKFGSIKWDKPSVNTDEATALTATFEHGVAKDEGKEYSVNFAQYVREGSDKFFMLICQHPLPLPEDHAVALEAMLKSIKVKNK
jgi:hypothetical protein|uniref:hypothetical protein n=1 Tax=Prosthecobacter sp. TaxID=1965333 RepID=UPI0037835D7D